MIKGRFETFSRRPMIDCYINIPALKVEGIVAFLIDTGADTTLLLPSDARRLNIDYNKLIYSTIATGIGGDCREHTVPAQLIVSDAKTAFGYRIALGIAEPKSELEECPSILGMNIMRYWRIECDYPEKTLQITVKMADDESEL